MSQIDYKIFRIACLTIINAMLFQELLAKSKPIKTLRQTVECIEVVNELNTQWKKIDQDQNRIIIDDVFSEILETPSLDILRKMLAREPCISMKVC